MLTGLDRVSLPVHDVDVAERFYVHVLGGERVRRSLAVEIWFGARPFVELVRVDAPASAEPRVRLAFTVRPDDLLRVRDDLRARGIPSHGPWRDGAPGHVCLDFLDPFGNPLELVTMGYRGETLRALPNMTELHYAWTAVDLSPRSTPMEEAPRSRPARAPRVSSRRLIQ